MIKIDQKINSYYKKDISFKSGYHHNTISNKADCRGVFIKSSPESIDLKSNFKKSNSPFFSIINFTGEKPEEPIITRECFYIRMYTYGTNYLWADKMIGACIEVSKMIKDKVSFFNIINYYMYDKISEINASYKFGCRRTNNTGGFQGVLLKRDRNDWRGSIEYFDKYEQKLKAMGNENSPKFKPKSNKKYPDANVCRISYYDDGYLGAINENEIFINYGWINDNGKFNEKSNLELCQKAYAKLLSKENPTEKEILDTCAIIQWLITQECPFVRGSDSVVNLLTKSIMLCYGIRISPVKKGISLDFEAFYSNLDDYIKNYPNFFEKYPKKLDKKSN